MESNLRYVGDNLCELSCITSGNVENTFLTFLTCYKCKKYSFKKVGLLEKRQVCYLIKGEPELQSMIVGWFFLNWL